jgi:hypothetical protein
MEWLLVYLIKWLVACNNPFCEEVLKLFLKKFALRYIVSQQPSE